jgi:hypothetical protein
MLPNGNPRLGLRHRSLPCIFGVCHGPQARLKNESKNHKAGRGPEDKIDDPARRRGIRKGRETAKFICQTAADRTLLLADAEWLEDRDHA